MPLLRPRAIRHQAGGGRSQEVRRESASESLGMDVRSSAATMASHTVSFVCLLLTLKRKHVMGGEAGVKESGS